jgi:UPF0755 protein
MRLVARVAIGLAVSVVVAAGAAFAVFTTLSVKGPLDREASIVIPRGAGLETISDLLTTAGVVDARWKVLLASRLKDRERSLKAGEYTFPAGVSVFGALSILKDGKTVVRRFTVPEGLTSAQIVQLLKDEPSFAGGIEEPPAEGSLLPETYYYSFGDSRAEMIGRMQAKMREVLAELWKEREPDAPVGSVEEAVILASIVEKETSVPEERARVAGVFANRLRQGMRLQSDPTVVYALTGGDGVLGRPLTRADWRVDSPYNTYAVGGLPPGPIANPGRASIEAALNPAKHDLIYFVADGSGGHAFARTLEEHNRNVARWRAFRNDQEERAAP